MLTQKTRCRKKIGSYIGGVDRFNFLILVLLGLPRRTARWSKSRAFTIIKSLLSKNWPTGSIPSVERIRIIHDTCLKNSIFRFRLKLIKQVHFLISYVNYVYFNDNCEYKLICENYSSVSL